MTLNKLASLRVGRSIVTLCIGLLLLVGLFVVSNNTTNAENAEDITDNLAGWWKFNDGSGTNANDESSNNNDGTLQDGATFDSDIPANASTGNTDSILFDGSGDFVQVDSPDLPAADHTYLAWVKYTNNDSTIFRAGDGSGGDEFKLHINSSDQVEVTYDNSIIMTSTTTLSSGTWHHIAVARSSNDPILYIDGQLETTTTDNTIFNFSTCALLVGADAGSSCTSSIATEMDGRIDDPRVYYRELNIGEIRRIYGESAPGDVFNDLRAWYDAQDTSTLFTDTGCSLAASTGNNIGCWQDKSGNSADVTEATNQPVYTAADLNGNDSVVFTADSLASTVTAIPTDSDYTIFQIFKFDATGWLHTVSSTSTAGATTYTPSNLSYFRTNNNSTTILDSVGDIDGTQYYLSTTRYSGSGDQEINIQAIDGTVVDSTATEASFTGAPITLGRRGAGTRLSGRIAEAAVYDRALSDAEVDSVECDLATKWGMTISDTCDSVQISTPQEFYTNQRDGSDEADINIEGIVNVTPCSAIEASWNGGGYTTIDSTIINGRFSGTLVDQSAGQGTLTARCTDNTSESDSIDNVGIGDVFVIAGQSNAHMLGQNTQSYSHGSMKAAFYNYGLGWKEGNDESSIAHVEGTYPGSAWPLLATEIMDETDLPVAFITTAIGGTVLASGNECWAKGSGASDLCYDEMVTAVNASNVDSIKAVIWHQGENDAVNNVAQATYNAALDQLAADINVDLPGSPKIIAASLGQVSTVSDARVDRVREATIEAWDDNPNILPGAILHDIGDLPDFVHLRTDAQLASAAGRWWAAIEPAFYGGSEDGRGPVITDAKVSTDMTRLLITLSDGELPLLPATNIDGFDVEDDGVSQTISSVSRVDDDKIHIILSSAASGTVTVSYGSGDDAINGGLYDVNPEALHDSSSFGVPAETVIDYPTTSGAIPILDYSGSFREVLANDGSVNGSIVATLTGDTFNATLGIGSELNVTGLPTGLSANVVRDSATQATITLTGNASPHADANDVSDLQINWLDGAFVTESTAANVVGYDWDEGEINFRDNGAPGGFTANLQSWYDAQDDDSLFTDAACSTSAADTDNVGCWQDLTDNENDATQGTGTLQPTIEGTDANGFPSLDFDTAYLNSSSTVIPSNSAYTQFMVWKSDSASANNVVGSSSAGGNTTYGGSSFNIWHNGANVLTATSAVDTAQYYLFVMRYGAPGTETNAIRKDGTELNNNSTTRNFTGNLTQLGALANANFLDGNIAEVLEYDTDMSDTDIATVECVLSAKWSISVSGCGPTIDSIVRQTPVQADTNSDTPTFRITFSEDVQNVDTSDFTTSGTVTGSPTINGVSTVNASTYDVDIAGVANENGTLNLDVSGSNNIEDLSSNALQSTTPTGSDESYTIDNLAPAAPGITSIGGDSSNPYTTNDSTPDYVGSGETGATVSVKEGAELCNDTVTGSAWSCTSSSVGDGTHNLSITQTDPAGNESTAITPSFDVDATQPDFDDSVRQAPTQADTNSDSPTFRVTFSEDVQNVDTADFSVSGTVTGSPTVNGVSVVNASTYDVDIAGVTNENGTLNLDIAGGHNITDLFGNSLSSTTATGSDETYTIDNIAPSAPTVTSIGGDSSAPYDTSDTTPTIAGGGENGSTVSVDEGSELCNDLVAATTWSCDSSLLGEGTHNLSITQTDLAGNESSAITPSFDIDTTDPDFDTSLRQSPSQYDTNSDSPTFRVTFSEDVQNVDTSDFTTSGTVSGSPTVNGVTPVSASVYDVDISGVTNENGTLNLDISGSNNIQDLVGNGLSSTTATGTDEDYNIDNTAPSAPTITSIGGDSSSPYLTGDNTPEFIGSGENGATVSVKEGVPELCNDSVSGSSWACTSGSLGDGTHNLSITQTDAAGNESPAITPSFDIDTSSLTFTSSVRQVPSQADTNSDSPTFRVSFNKDVQNVDTTDFTTSGSVTGSPVINGVTTVNASTYDVDISGVNNENGTLNLDIVGGNNIEDLAANPLSSTTPTGTDESYTIDNIAPSAPTITSIGGDASSPYDTNDTTPDFVGGGENGATVSVNQGAQLCSDTVAGSSWSCTSSLLGDGTHNLTITQTDPAGNVSSAITPSFDVDGTDPDFTSSTRQAPTQAITNSDTPTFRVTFSEDVQNVDTSDFTTSGTVTGSPTINGVTTINASTYDVDIAGVSNEDGTLNLDIQGANNITDLFGNSLSSTTATGLDESFTIDNTPPAQPTLTNVDGDTTDPYDTNDPTPNFIGTGVNGETVHVSELAVDLCTFVVAGGVWSCDSTSLNDTSHSIDVYQQDAAGNQSTYLSITVNVDANAPNVNSIVRRTPTAQYTAADTPEFRVTFSEDVQNVDSSDFDVTGSTVGTSINSVTAISPAIYDVDIAGAANVDGTLGITVNGGHNITDLAAQSLSSTTPTGANQTYIMDNTAPSAPSFTTIGGDGTQPYSTTDTTPTVTGTAETSASVTIKKGGSTLCSATASGGTFSCISSSLSVGTHTISATAQDQAGNVSVGSSVDVEVKSAPNTSQPSTPPSSTPLLPPPLDIRDGIETDSDGDGVDDEDEDNTFNGGDSNGDGVKDSRQKNVVAIKNSFTGNYQSIEVDNPCLVLTYKIVDPAAYIDSDKIFPGGLNEFTADDCGDASEISASIYFESDVALSDMEVLKFVEAEDSYVDFSSYSTISEVVIGDKDMVKLTFKIVDGGRFDSDGKKNGSISDPIGIASTPSQLPSTELPSNIQPRIDDETENRNYLLFIAVGAIAVIVAIAVLIRLYSRKSNDKNVPPNMQFPTS